MAKKRKQSTNIAESHQALFAALQSGDYDNFALFSCFVNGQAATAIVTVEKQSDASIAIVPHFVSVTADMILTDHEGVTCGH